MRSVVQTTNEMLWIQTDCPATHDDNESKKRERAVCVLARASRLAGNEQNRSGRVPLREPVVSISVRLGTGNPNDGVWQLERPTVEDAFIERGLDSVTVPRLGDLARLLSLRPAQWPKSDLRVMPDDMRCDKILPAPGDRVRCQATIRNRGSVDALARISAALASSHTDIGLGKDLPRRAIPAKGSIVIEWDWVWTEGRAWTVIITVDLLTPRGYGGYRIPIRERNVSDNRAYLHVPPRK
jgi:hypothetical protein